jgi:cAMP-dependent protein kinase regulator
MGGSPIHIGPRGAVEATLDVALRRLARDPADAVARQRAAESLARLGRTSDAIEHYARLVEIWAAEGRLLRAIAVAHRILSLDPAHAATQSRLADLVTARASSSNLEELARVPLFSELGRDAFLSVLKTLERRTVRRGETILEEGEPGEAMFVIAHGQVRIVRRGPDRREPHVIDELSDGEFFGEMALVSHGPRFASVIALTDGELLVVHRDRLEEITRAHPSVGEVVMRFYKRRLLSNVLRASSLFGLLPDSMLQTIVEVFHVQPMPPGTLLLEEGAPGKGLFVLLRGECEVFHRGPDGAETPYPTMREGDVFGELSLLRDGIATASVRTRGPCVVLELKRDWFDELLLAQPAVRDRIYEIAGERTQRTNEVLAREALQKRLV